MTTLNEIKDRLDALELAGRSYAMLDPRIAAQKCAGAAAAFEKNAPVDMAYLLARVEEMQTAITVAAAELADAAVDVADRYASNDAETLEIRLMIGDPVDKLINVAQGTAITPKEAGE